MNKPNRNLNRAAACLLLPLVLAVLVACGSQPQTAGTPGSLELTSDLTVDGLNYVLTGTFELPGDGEGTLEYSLNDGEWQALDLRAGGAFSVSLTLRSGQNKIAVALTTAAGVRTQREFVVTATASVTEPAPDEQPPQILLTSARTVLQPEYLLSGVVLDNVAAESATYSLAGAEPVTLDLNNVGMFEADLLLQAGPNIIDISAVDLAGNTGTESLTVTWLPQIEDVTASPMIALSGSEITLTGRNFGAAAGSIMVGDAAARILSWTDTGIVAEVPAASTGWLDIEVRGANNTFTLTDFFAGIEVMDSAQLLASMLDPDATGTALLLSGSDYALQSPPTETQLVLSGGFSLYGSRTAGDPVTNLQLDSSSTVVLTRAEFGMQWQDLNISAQSLAFLQFSQPPTEVRTSLPPGLTLRNVDILSSDLSGFGTMLAAGIPGSGDNAPIAVQLLDVSGEGFNGIVVQTGSLQIRNSTLLANEGFNLAASIEGLLEITNSRIEGPSFGAITSHSESVVQNNVFAADDLQVAQLIDPGSWTGNELTAENLQLNGVSGLTLERNQINLTGMLLIGTGGLTLDDNTVELVGGLNVHAAGTTVLTDNDFTFDEPDAATRAFTFTSATGTAVLEFSGNTSTGIDRLFAFTASGGQIDAELRGNSFDADLTAPGDVALLFGTMPPASIVAGGNTWGTLATAAAVAALIDYTGGAGPGDMVIEEF